MPDGPVKSSKHVLDPIDRASEVLFGLIMVLTYTGSLSVAQAGRDDVRVMLVGALGCNLAWGIIDAIFYVMGCLAEKRRDLGTLLAVRHAMDPQRGPTPHRRPLAADRCVRRTAGGTRIPARAPGPAARATAPRAPGQRGLARRRRRVPARVRVDLPGGDPVHRHGRTRCRPCACRTPSPSRCCSWPATPTDARRTIARHGWAVGWWCSVPRWSA